VKKTGGRIVITRKLTVSITAAIILGSHSIAVSAQEAAWPTRTVKVIVPSTPGGGLDYAARIFAEFWSKEFGRPFVVENVPGAANTLGTAAVARAAPDGHTILHASLSPIVIVPFIRKNLNYKPGDLAPVGQTMATTNTLVINPGKIDARTLPDLIRLLKAAPDKYNYGSSGVGGFSHLIHELFMLRTGTRITHIPHKGPNDVTTALLGGHIDLAFVSTTPILPHLKTGSLRAIGVAPAQRLPELPDVPAIREIVPEFGGATSWNGLFVPAGTPRAIIDKLNQTITAFLRTRQAAEAMEKMGATAVATSPEEFAEFIKQETEMWGKVIKASGVSDN
jgi:tripartite-type tricarboxylate transporter receptor subunit TctC